MVSVSQSNEGIDTPKGVVMVVALHIYIYVYIHKYIYMDDYYWANILEQGVELLITLSTCYPYIFRIRCP